MITSLKSNWKKINETKAVYLLTPLSLLYFIVTTIRKILYDINILKSYKTKAFTICIGNITVGGNGKTPLTLYLAEKIKDNNLKLAILSRGYGSRSIPKARLVTRYDDSTSIGDEASIYNDLIDDETLLVISQNRKYGIDLLESLDCKLILMDDGFQHFRIKPTLSLCLVDISEIDDYLNYSICNFLPCGIFREAPKQGIRRASRVVFIKRSTLNESDLNKIEIFKKTFKITKSSTILIEANEVRHVLNANKLLTAISNNKVIAFSSIAKPELFFNNLRNLGFELIKTREFPDHHNFTESEFNDILKLANDLPVICTYKDIVKVKRWTNSNSNLYYLSQIISDKSEEGEQLLSWLKSSLELESK